MFARSAIDNDVRRAALYRCNAHLSRQEIDLDALVDSAQWYVDEVATLARIAHDMAVEMTPKEIAKQDGEGGLMTRLTRSRAPEGLDHILDAPDLASATAAFEQLAGDAAVFMRETIDVGGPINNLRPLGVTPDGMEELLGRVLVAEALLQRIERRMLTATQRIDGEAMEIEQWLFVTHRDGLRRLEKMHHRANDRSLRRFPKVISGQASESLQGLINSVIDRETLRGRAQYGSTEEAGDVGGGVATVAALLGDRECGSVRWWQRPIRELPFRDLQAAGANVEACINALRVLVVATALERDLVADHLFIDPRDIVAPAALRWSRDQFAEMVTELVPAAIETLDTAIKTPAVSAVIQAAQQRGYMGGAAMRR